MSTDEPRPSRASVRLALLMSFVLLTAYRHSLFAPFIFDDFSNIVQNRRIERIWPIWPVVEGNNRPVAFVSLAINYTLSEKQTWSYHLVNLSIHLAACFALFGLARRSLALSRSFAHSDGQARRLAFAIALIWAIHPLQTQSVTYIIQRCESLMGMFFLLFLYCLVRSCQSPIGWLWRCGALLCCVLGMGCKEVMATAPIVGLLYDRAFLATSWGTTLRRRGVWHAFYLATSVALLAYCSPWIFSKGERATMGFGVQSVTAWEYLRTQPEIILHYLRLSTLR